MKNEKPFVNIIILNWNNYEDTCECVDSLKKLNYPRWGITIIDNGSTDKSGKKMVKRFGGDRKIKIVLKQENLGFAGGNNLGMQLDLFDADYFLLLNNDTIVDKNLLNGLINEKQDLIAPTVYNYYFKKELSWKDSPGKFNFLLGGGKKIKIKKGRIQKVDYASGSCWMVGKSLFNQTKGFNENYFAYNEEIEWAYRLKEKGYSFYISSKARIWHKVARTSKKVSGLRLKLMNRNMIWFERKYASIVKYSIFLLYFFGYKVPKNLIKILISKKNILGNIKSLSVGIKEGLLSRIK